MVFGGHFRAAFHVMIAPAKRRAALLFYTPLRGAARLISLLVARAVNGSNAAVVFLGINMAQARIARMALFSGSVFLLVFATSWTRLHQAGITHTAAIAFSACRCA